jgi:hypothetical protein
VEVVREEIHEQDTARRRTVCRISAVIRPASRDDKGAAYWDVEQPTGYVSLTPTRFWLMFIDSTRKVPAAPALTDAEAIASMKSHVAWTGKYATADQTPDGIKVTAHVDIASSQAITGTDRVYFMRVEGNRLVVKSSGVIVPMTGMTSIVEFELVKAE